MSFIPFTPCLAPKDLYRKPKKSPQLLDARFQPDKIVFTYSGAAALSSGARSLKQMNIQHLVAPSFNCGKEIDPFLREKFSISFYRVNEKGMIDVDHFASLLSGKNQVALITYYFGFPQDIRAIREVCRVKGVYLLEDCAHSYLSKIENSPLGSWGDLAIFSYRKSLPIPDGGALIINHPDIPMLPPSMKPQRLAVYKKTTKLLFEQFFLSADSTSPLRLKLLLKVKRALIRFESLLPRGAGRKRLQFYSPDDRSYEFNAQILDWQMSPTSLRILGNLDTESIVQKRRDNYQYVEEAFRNTRFLRPLFPALPDGICPLQFPFVTPKDHPKAQDVMTNYPLLYKWWPNFHPAVSWRDFPESSWLKENCFYIPIHQDMKKKHLDFLIDCVLKADTDMR